MQQDTKVKKPQLNLLKLIKKYFWFIILFFVVSIASGIFLAEMEANSPTTWKTYTSKAAGLSFKYPASYNIVEDKGWRITIYTSKTQPENNIKIIYSHKDSAALHDSVESQFLANCQANRVNEINADGTRIKVFEDSTCGAQQIGNSVIVYSENDMDYDIGIFGKVDRKQLNQFFSTFQFK